MKFFSFKSGRSQTAAPMGVSNPSPYGYSSQTTRQPKDVATSLAIAVALLTAGNGLISLVNGIQWFVAGGSLVPHLDAVEVLIGTIILMASFFMIAVLLTKLKVMPRGEELTR